MPDTPPDTAALPGCPERFDRSANLDRTHSCSLPAGHDGPHVCPLCESEWEHSDADW